MNHLSKESISLTNAGKWFWTGFRSKKWAVRGVSIQIERGQVVGLLGPNGSGKSTTLKMLLGFLQPSEGSVEIFGQSPLLPSARHRLGYLPENPRLPRFLTAEQLLRYFGQLYGLSGKELQREIDQQLAWVRLDTVRNERIHGFSKGMIQRLAFAQSLMNRAPVLILDEPMSGLDPLGRMEMRSLLQSIPKHRPQATLLFSTHILSDVEELCTSVILLKSGRMIAHTPIASVLESGMQLFEVIAQNVTVEKASQWQGAIESITNERFRFTIQGVADLACLLKDLEQIKASVISVRSRQNRLEQILFGEATAVT